MKMLYEKDTDINNLHGGVELLGFIRLNNNEFVKIKSKTPIFIDLAYDTNDTIEEFGVTFRFNYMTAHKGQVNRGGEQNQKGSRGLTDTGTGSAMAVSDSESPNGVRKVPLVPKRYSFEGN